MMLVVMVMMQKKKPFKFLHLWHLLTLQTFAPKDKEFLPNKEKTGKKDKFAAIEVGGLITWQRKFLPRPRN